VVGALNRFRCAASAIAVLVVALGAGATAAPAGAATPPERRLYMITDSVGLGAAPAIRAAFAGWQVTIDADPGEFTETLEQKYVVPRLATTPDVFGDHAIVATGYNYPYWDPDRFDRSVDSMIATLERAGVEHVHWVTLREVREHDVSPAAWRQAAGYRWYLATVNDHLERALARHPNLTLIDWARVADRPDITYDAIHLNTTGASLYATLAKRIVDGAATTVADGSVTRIAVPDAGGVSAVSVNVTVTDTRDVGYLTAYPCDAGAPPTASFHNYVRDDVVAHSTIVPLDGTGAFCIATRVAANLIVDITGRFTAGGGYRPVGPTRWVDTRDGRSPVPSGGRLWLDIDALTDELDGAAESAAAVALSVTATGTTGPGYLRVAGACRTADDDTSSTSNVNYLGGDTVPNLVVAELDGSGRLCIEALTRTDVVVDLLGVFDAAAGVEASDPDRVFDSRRAGRPLAPADIRTLTATQLGVPAGTPGLVLNVTAVDADLAGYASVFPCDGAAGGTSQLNMPGPSAVSNAVLVAADGAGSVCASASGSTHLVVDVMGTLGNGFTGIRPDRLLDTRQRPG
jgi:hypothetical protein